jgi:hypothetical protein
MAEMMAVNSADLKIYTGEEPWGSGAVYFLRDGFAFH